MDESFEGSIPDDENERSVAASLKSWLVLHAVLHVVLWMLSPLLLFFGAIVLAGTVAALALLGLADRRFVELRFCIAPALVLIVLVLGGLFSLRRIRRTTVEAFRYSSGELTVWFPRSAQSTIESRRDVQAIRYDDRYDVHIVTLRNRSSCRLPAKLANRDRLVDVLQRDIHGRA